MEGPSCGHSGLLCSGRKSRHHHTVHQTHLNIMAIGINTRFDEDIHILLIILCRLNGDRLSDYQQQEHRLIITKSDSLQSSWHPPPP